MMDRRKFLQLSAAATAAISLPACNGKKQIKGGMVGESANIGHLLRDKNFDAPVETEQKKTVIIGGGISGLTTAYFLRKNGEDDFIVFDLEKEAGGNSRWGNNSVSAFPWGAHYIPTPNNDLTEYLSFLKECGVITGYDAANLPVYNEQYLCFDPQERLYINGRWQDSLVPNFGVPTEEQKQISRFFQLMEIYRNKKGTDGKQAFAIPIDHSSKDVVFTYLDSLTMKDWMTQNGFTSSYLHWYVNYCTRDDFGATHAVTSAWMGIHYFASRKGRGANADHHDVLTWPEGNGFLVKQLSKNIQPQIRTGCLVVKVQQLNDAVHVIYFDTKDNKVKAVQARHAVMAMPQFIAARLLGDEGRKKKVDEHFHYSPWMVANLTVKELKERSGAPLSWDNVLHESESLGYVEATHELLRQKIAQKNLTYYLPLTHLPPKEARKEAQQKTYEQWVNLVMNDLRKPHPNIEEATTEINILLWGHAMVQPLPGLVHGPVRGELGASIGNIHFAHTDLSGASIFEEAFYQGLHTANKILSKKIAHV